MTAENKPAPLGKRKFTPLPKKGRPQHKVNAAKLGKLFAAIEATQLPEGYQPWKGKNSEDYGRIHQAYVDKRMAGLSKEQRSRVGQLWQQRRKLGNMKNAGASFVKVMEWVANNVK